MRRVILALFFTILTSGTSCSKKDGTTEEPTQGGTAPTLQTQAGQSLFAPKTLETLNIQTLQISYADWSIPLKRETNTNRWFLSESFPGKAVSDRFADSPKIDHFLSLLGTLQIVDPPDSTPSTDIRPFKIRINEQIFLELTVHPKLRVAAAVAQDRSKPVSLWVTGAALEMLPYFHDPVGIRQRRLFQVLSDDVSTLKILQGEAIITELERFDEGQKQLWKPTGNSKKRIDFDPLLDELTHLQISEFIDRSDFEPPSHDCVTIQLTLWVGAPVQAKWCNQFIQTSERAPYWFKLFPKAKASGFAIKVRNKVRSADRKLGS